VRPLLSPSLAIKVPHRVAGGLFGLHGVDVGTLLAARVAVNGFEMASQRGCERVRCVNLDRMAVDARPGTRRSRSH